VLPWCLDHALDPVLGHADLAQGSLGPEPAGKIEERLRNLPGPQCSRSPRHGFWSRWQIICGGVGEKHAMRLRMRQVEGASENMAELVVQRHAHHAETMPAQPGSVKRI
jgi:hypothetical protein